MMPGICDRIVPPTTDLGYRREVRCHLYEPEYQDREEALRIHAIEAVEQELDGETDERAS
jgi:hypothetical protein